MTRDVLARKLARLRTLIEDLRPHADKAVEQVIEDRYEIERLLQLVVQVGVDLVTHDLAERGMVTDSYRQTFLEAARLELIPHELGARLADAAGLRNVIVPLYDDIDYEIVAASIRPALEDFGRLAEVYARRL